MKSHRDILMLIGCWIFSIGFVGAGSGWTWMLGQWINDRPAWSVCGQDMCACVPTTAIEPACPLCELGEDKGSACESESAPISPERGVPIMKKMDALGYASSSMLIALFVVVTGAQHPSMQSADAHSGWNVDACTLPRGPTIGVPTPPPRRA